MGSMSASSTSVKGVAYGNTIYSNGTATITGVLTNTSSAYASGTQDTLNWKVTPTAQSTALLGAAISGSSLAVAANMAR